ncbi:HlyD family secretion protein [Chitinophagaceae bacterium LB-8]|uniref:HlyD family secretion protein n=1 Tax=Paraflavisolibacter caeni TaxID=2982496 RepID=A0A9X2XWJ2_9BACT|nr:HlyD family efflux transporter periplasmic adaptor subunit [Paraflavisolibacter caeni]MCU7549957.1 HlyD family secretion protein [Paraflavisolibacter caeni]
MILPFDSNCKEVYLCRLNKNVLSIYWVILFMLMLGLAALPFFYFDIAVKASGIIRPLHERTEIKAAVSGIIESIDYAEGQVVPKEAVILRIKNNSTGNQKMQTDFEIAHRQQFIHDLQLLTSNNAVTQHIYSTLISPIYKQQASRFSYQQAEQITALKKIKSELKNYTQLTAEGVMAPNELKDKKIENDKLQAATKAFRQEQLSIWQGELEKYRLELSQLQAQQQQLTQDAKYYEVKAPVRGTLQGINAKYIGGLLQAGETLGTLSPETELVAECYIPTRDAGLLRKGQEVKFQIDAFDYKYFGIVTGKLISIDNDFTLVNNQSTFKVRCSFDQKQLHLKNGFTGQLKKGLTIQARFILTQRSLWQLLFDKIDDWTNPSASEQ